MPYRRLYLRYALRSLRELCLRPHQWRSRLPRLAMHWRQFRIAGLPRYTPCSIRAAGVEVELVDPWSFFWTFEEIFDAKIYRFESDSPEPLIIDGGANVGLSVLYFKRLHPRCRILAFEPDPAVFAVLRRNVERWGLEGVDLFDKALWSAAGTLDFASEGADAGRVLPPAEAAPGASGEGAPGAGATSGGAVGRVEAIRLRDYLDRPIDLLKLDIEGAEVEVLRDCADRLGHVRRVFVEYHSFADRPQELHVLLSVLADAGFRLHVHVPYRSPRPFVERRVNMGLDLLLNVFAVRE